MATFCVCSRCGTVQETDVLDQLPKSWRRSIADLYCPHCAKTAARESVVDGLDEEVIYPADSGGVSEDTLDEGFCEICTGPCHGH